jgi:23S rRNA pseudouridine2605 synthase
MKKDSKLKANSGAKSPAAKAAPKGVAKSRKIASTKTTAKSKTAGADKGGREVVAAKTKTVTAKAGTPAAKASKAKAGLVEKPAAKRAPEAKKPKARSEKPIAAIKATGAKTRKVKSDGAASFKIGEPVLDPIGDVISGEARTYQGEPENLGKVEMAAYRDEVETEAVDGTPEPGPGMKAATGAGAAGDTDDGDQHETGAEEKPVQAERPPAKLERLQKILSQAGIASRRHAEEMIVAGQVMVNGQVVTQLGSKADAARDHIRVNGKLLKGAERHRYFMLNKPKGYMTTVSDPEGRPTVMDFFAKSSERLYPVGRLDYQSEGLLLMTNDGELANLVTKAGSGVEKVYLVKVAGQPTEDELDRLRKGIAIERGEAGSERVVTAPARIRQVRVGENPWYEVVLTEGRNRELRKMFAAIGHFAEKIRRVGYGPLVLDLEPGKLRELTVDEVSALRATAEGRMKPRRMRVDISLPKDAGRGPGQRGGRTQWKPRESGAGRSQGRGGERPRFDKRAGGPSRAGSGFGARPSRPFAGKPGFGGERKEWKPRERPSSGGREGSGERGGERPSFDKRASGPPRAGSGFGARPSRPFAAKPGFGGERKEWKPRERPSSGGREGSGERGGERPRFDKRAGGPPRAGSSFGARPSKPFGDRPKFGGGRDSGAGKSFGRSAEKKPRWIPRPGAARNDEARGQAAGGDRPKPAFGARPDGGERPGGNPRAGGFKRPSKPGGFARPGGSSKPGGFSKQGGFSKTGRPSGGASRGGSRFGGKRPGGR